MPLETNERDCWRAGEVDYHDIICGWCGEPSETDICAQCQYRYACEQAE